jgi:tetratricopeptide (TPR) repeat protein
MLLLGAAREENAMSSDLASHDQQDSTPHVVSPALRRRLQQCYEHGINLTKQEKYDFDYANTLFTECVVNDPGNLVYVEAFLENLQRKYNNNKTGARFRGFGGRGALKKAASAQDSVEVLKLGPDFLKTNPWEIYTLRTMADACAALGYNEVELRYLKNALGGNPKDAEVSRHCARSLARMGQFDQAIACWHRVEEIKRGDKEAPEMISALTVEKTRAAAGIGSDNLPPPTQRARTAAVPSTRRPQQTTSASGSNEEAGKSSVRREIPLTPRQRLERAIVEHPSFTDNYLELADLLIGEDRHAEAERVLTKALAASGNDIKIQERLEDAQTVRAQHQLAIAEKRAESEGTAEAAELVKQLRGELVRRELEIFARRAERYPEDRELQFQLAMRLKWSGNYAEALKQFQQAAQEPRRQAVSTLEIGECLQHLRQYQKALDCYLQASSLAADEPHIKTLALYRAGVLATGLKDYAQAEELLAELATLDSGYKDVADRLDKLRQIRHKG